MKLENGVLTDLDACDFDATRLVFPRGMTAIAEEVNEQLFILDKVETVEMEEDNEAFYVAGNCLIYRPTKTVVFGCKNSVIPADGSVDSIAACAFCNRGLTEFVIPDTVTEIGDLAFKDSGWQHVRLPRSVTMLGRGVFGGMDVPQTLEVDAENPVYRSEGNCILRRADHTLVACTDGSVVPQGVKTVEELSLMLFAEQAATVTFPDSVQHIEESHIGLPSFVEFPIVFAAPQGSYVQAFAEAKGASFVPTDGVRE